MAFSSLKMQRRPTQTKAFFQVFTLSKKRKNTRKPSKVEAAKNVFSSVCMLLVQLASMNAFYSM